MNVQETKVSIQRTAAVYHAEAVGTPSSQWFGCHGYGQLASNLIQKFDDLVAGGASVVCPEAPNRFYWKGVRGNAVATWMTSRYRLEEIEDNNQYLTTIYDQYCVGDTPRVLFGFSQGGTTVWRWIHAERPDFDVFVNYAGWIPEDIDLRVLQEYLGDKKLIYIIGSEDEYMTPQRIDALQMVIDRSGLDIEMIKIAGDHRIDRKVLKKVAKSLFI